MLLTPHCNRNYLKICLMVYCLIGVYYIGLMTPNSAHQEQIRIYQHQLKGKENPAKEAHSTNAREVHVKPTDVEEPVEYKHSRNPGFPLSGAMRVPAPGFQLGQISAVSEIVIGIPTVQREGVDYLIPTIESLFHNKGNKMEGKVKIVVYVGEDDIDVVKKKSDDVLRNFPSEIQNGHLQVISPPSNYYPKWDSVLESSFNDSIKRVRWRSKQNLDQIFLMMHIYYLSPTYYLMLEDDIVASPGFMEKMLTHLKSRVRTEDWFYISYCALGAIGKLFKTSTLPSYASFIHMFWNKKPLDWLQIDYVATWVCSHDEDTQKCFKRRSSKMLMYQPSLFQHVGKVSSLQGKIQSLKDHSFNKQLRQ